MRCKIDIDIDMQSLQSCHLLFAFNKVTSKIFPETVEICLYVLFDSGITDCDMEQLLQAVVAYYQCSIMLMLLIINVVHCSIRSSRR